MTELDNERLKLVAPRLYKTLYRVADEMYGEWVGHCSGKCLPCAVWFAIYDARGQPFDDDEEAVEGGL